MDLQKPGTGTSGAHADRLAALIIHADKAYCNLLAGSLAQESIDAEAASDAAEGFRILGRRSFDAVIVDESMRSEGPEALWEQLALRLPQGTALYLVTERSAPEVMGQFHTRIKALFHKPFETEVLLCDLKSFIREKKLYGAKRKWDRIPLLAETSFQTLDGHPLPDAMMLNLSVGGFFAVFPKGTKLPEQGNRLRFSVRIPGQKPMTGECTLQWCQTENGVGCGCEFFAPSADTMEMVCEILNGVRTRQLSQDLRTPVRISDLAQQTARIQSWLETRPVLLTDYACVCDTEITCFAPLVLANLAGVVRSFGSNCCKEGSAIELDLVTTEIAAEFRLSCKNATVTLGSVVAIDKLMPKLQLAGGGREMLIMHNASVEFALREGGPLVSFRVPLRNR